MRAAEILTAHLTATGDYIGADVQWSAGLSALAPFYHRGHWPVKWQLFANMGKLTDVRGGQSRPPLSERNGELTDTFAHGQALASEASSWAS